MQINVCIAEPADSGDEDDEPVIRVRKKVRYFVVVFIITLTTFLYIFVFEAYLLLIVNY